MNQSYAHSRLTLMEIVESFGGMIGTIHREKKKEILDELMPVYDHIDFINNGPYSEEVKQLGLIFFKTQLTDRQKMLFKSLEHMRKVKNMTIMYGIGRRRDKNVGLLTLPLHEARQIPFEEVHDFEKIKKNRGGFTALCPLHGEKTPSFTVYHKNNRFKCFGCNKSGDTIQFIMYLNGMSFVDAVKFLGKIHYRGGV